MNNLAFRTFWKDTEAEGLYTPNLLWDYLRTNLEPSILGSPDSHRWALAAQALDRCESVGGNENHLKLLKTISVIDLFKERSGIVADFKILKTCFHESSDQELLDLLSQLEKWSLIVFRKYLSAYAIFAGSDFDIEHATQSALERADEVDFNRLKSLAGIQPILAKRHYHETGTMRWFEVNIVPVGGLLECVEQFFPQNGTIGQFILALPTEGETEEKAKEICIEAANHHSPWDNLVGLSNLSWVVVHLARELLALETLSEEYPELAGDSVARHEISARFANLQSTLERELQKSFDNAFWFGESLTARRLKQSEINNFASELADRRYAQCPYLHNELLNRQRPSGSAVAAQNNLLRCMVLNNGQPRLGIKNFPAEAGLFLSLLEASHLYRQDCENWRFMPPCEDSDPCNLFPMWAAGIDLVQKNPIAVADLYSLWREPPFGVKDGLLPVLSTAFILSLADKLAVYREELFKSNFDDVDVEYLAKDASSIQIRWMDLSDIAFKLLSDMAIVVREINGALPFPRLEPIDVARGLVAVFDNLPQWTKRTNQLSKNAIRIRHLFSRARDPNKFLFDDIPELLGQKSSDLDDDSLKNVVKSVSDGLTELVEAYPLMLCQLRGIMLSELQVPNLSPQSLSELRKRALNIRQVVGDFKLEAFIGRVSQFNGNDLSIEDIAGLIASKPPRQWVDADCDRTALEIADMAQKFLRAESFARVKGRKDTRHAMAVVVGMDGRPTPVHDEFAISDLERGQVDFLIEQIDRALKHSGENRRNIILAALAELSARHLKQATVKPRDMDQREQAS